MSLLRIDSIRLDGGTQPRAELNEDVIADYAEHMRDGVVFPDVIVFYDGSDHWLADGFHRVHGAIRADLKFINADVRQGTRREAVLYSVGANSKHGLRRSNEDKRRAVTTLLSDDEWRKWSDREIARRCGVGNKFVGDVRRSLFPEHSEDGTQDTDRTYTTKHGTVTVMNTARIGTKPARIGSFDPDDGSSVTLTPAELAEGDTVRTRTGRITQITRINGRFAHVEGDTRVHDLQTLTKLDALPAADDETVEVETAVDDALAGLVDGDDAYDITDPKHNPTAETHPYWGTSTDPAICPTCHRAHFNWRALPGALWRCGDCGTRVADDAMEVETAEDRAMMRRAAGRNGKTPKPAMPEDDPTNDEWYTPADVIEDVRAFLGTIDLDPASCDYAQQTVKALAYYTRKMDGLRHKWHGNVWLNPPYSYPLVESFVLKLLDEYAARRIQQAVVLVNNRTDAEWFHRLLQNTHGCIFTAGRINFERPNRNLPGNRQGQAFFYLGDRPSEFVAMLGKYGTPVRLAQGAAV